MIFHSLFPFIYLAPSFHPALLCRDFKAVASAGLGVSLSYILALQRDCIRSVGDKSLRPPREVPPAQWENDRWKPQERLPVDSVKQVGISKRYYYIIFYTSIFVHFLRFFCMCLQMAGHPFGVCWKPGGVFRRSICCPFQRLFGQRHGWPVHILRSKRQWLMHPFSHQLTDHY